MIIKNVNNHIIGGYSLIKKDINGKKGSVLECLFSDEKGLGKLIIQKIIGVEKRVFAYSNLAGGFFEKLGFKKVEGEVSETGAQLYEYNNNNNNNNLKRI